MKTESAKASSIIRKFIKSLDVKARVNSKNIHANFFINNIK